MWCLNKAPVGAGAEDDDGWYRASAVVTAVTLYRNGLSAGKPGMPNHKAKRSTIGGWSYGAARRNEQFLKSVDADGLAELGEAVAFTLTVRDCPPTPEVWSAAVERFLLAMKRTHGCVAAHWVVEWQRRHVPHLHGCLIFPAGRALSAEQIAFAWCYLTDLGAMSGAQHVVPMRASVGWFQYVAKHASRGVKHYQRSPEAIPEKWKGKTGRMWGQRGEWPLIVPRKFALQDQLNGGDGGWFAYRRLVRAWAVAQARKAGDRARLAWCRRMLRCPAPDGSQRRSRLRGLSQWLPETVSERFLLNLQDRGYSVVDRSESSLQSFQASELEAS